jgi:hypothetical protein
VAALSAPDARNCRETRRTLAGAARGEYDGVVDSCRVCGGDGRIANSFGGGSKTCPACHGTGRRVEEALIRDVTKTKPSHHGIPSKGTPAAKTTWPTTFDGSTLANEVKASGLSEDAKARLVREIIEYEGSHGKCTQTFTKKVRKQLR